MLKIVLSTLLMFFCVQTFHSVDVAQKNVSLEDRFLRPYKEAKPWVFWFWMDGNVSKEGITADLEAMNRIGIGGAVMMGVGLQTPPGKADFNSPLWRELYKHAADECVRLGMKLSLHQCDGWATAGGPWIEPSQSIKMMVWTKKEIEGSYSGKIVLKKPEVRENIYQEVAVVAIPFTVDIVKNPQEVIVNGSKNQTLMDRDKETGENNIKEIIVRYDEAREISTLRFTFKKVMRKEYIPTTVEISEDGNIYKKVKALDIHILDAENIENTLTFSFPPTKAKTLRIRMQSAMKRPINELTVFSKPRVDLWEAKTSSARTREHGGETFMIDSSLQFPVQGIPQSEVINLSDKLSDTGELKWDVPKGKWQIIRVGMTSSGKHVAPRTNAGVGLEADKMSGEAMRYHFDAFAKGMLAENNNVQGTPIYSVHTDSWESGIHNWSSSFQQEFEKRCGYSIIPFLPTLTAGTIIGSNEDSNRFLWDVRRTMADLIAENFYGVMLEKCHENGVLFQSEAAGRQMFMYDPINYAAKTDICVGEFWTQNEVRVDCKLAASVAHIYGRDIAAAEAFTSTSGGGRSYNFNYDMFDIKALGDHAFCTGINRYIIHRYCMQPFNNVEPGLTFGPFGICFERTQTWWENGAKAWCEYVTRCQSLLQTGRFVADVIYFIGHDAPNYLGHRDEIWNPVPAGYDYDGCNLEILKQLKIGKDGMFHLPSGMTYRVLLLPKRDHMTIEAAREVERLVKAGGVLIGSRPLHASGLKKWEKNDAELKEITNRVWGNIDGTKVTENRYRKGKIIFGQSIESVLNKMAPPDFAYFAKEDAKIRYIHRYTDDADFYFVANADQEEELDAILCFRVSGKAPELWDASTGKMIKPSIYRQTDGITELPVHFDRAGSWFVVFRDETDPNAIIEVSKDGKVLFPIEEKESYNGAFIPDIKIGVTTQPVFKISQY